MANTAITKYLHSEPVMRRFVEVLGASAPTFIAEVLALYRLREHKHMAAWVDACRQSQQGQ